MKILFITGIYPLGMENDFRNKCKNKTIQNAPNEFQWRFIEGLYENGADFHVVSTPFLPCWPNYNQLYTGKGNITYKNKIIGKYIDYCTLPFIKVLSLKYRLRHYIRKFLNKYPNEQVCIITYNSLGYMQQAIKPLKSKYKIKLVSIITDLIDDATNPTFKLSTAKYIQARLEQKRIWESYNYTDGFILLSEHMTERIPQSIGRNIIVEGIAKNHPNKDIVEKTDTTKTLVYTGSLAEFTCVKKLVDAFMETEGKNFRLVICGNGKLAEYIKDCAATDKRIDFKGPVPHHIVVELQENATAVINPRQPITTITKYSFPSKTMEYLLSGTPMIGYKLEGIPNEYYEHFYSPVDLSIEALADTIETVLNSSSKELMQKAIKAQNYIIQNKTSTKQIERVLSFIDFI